MVEYFQGYIPVTGFIRNTVMPAMESLTCYTCLAVNTVREYTVSVTLITGMCYWIFPCGLRRNSMLGYSMVPLEFLVLCKSATNRIAIN